MQGGRGHDRAIGSDDQVPLTVNVADFGKPRHGGPLVGRSGTGIKKRGKIVDQGKMIGLGRQVGASIDRRTMPELRGNAQRIAGIINPEALLLLGSDFNACRKLGPALGLGGTGGEMQPQLPQVGHADDPVSLG